MDRRHWKGFLGNELWSGGSIQNQRDPTRISVVQQMDNGRVEGKQWKQGKASSFTAICALNS